MTDERATCGMPRALRSAGIHSFLTPLWTLALLGIFLLPTNYRAGAVTAHGHSLLQLWVDATDGRMLHHTEAPSGVASVRPTWFDPLVTDQTPTVNDPAAPDSGDQSDSMPASGGGQFLVVSVIVVIASVAARAAIVFPFSPLHGWSPTVPSPPPRWMSAAV